MKKHIFRSVCIATITVFLVSLALIFGVLYDYFSNAQIKQLKTETLFVAKGVESGGKDYLSSLKSDDYRITWVASDGTVLYDNKANPEEMENHLAREEISRALQTGEGSSTRYSSIMMEKQYYHAIKLQDGTVLRLSKSYLTWWMLLFGMLQPLLIIVVFAIGLALFLAYRLSSRIVKPLNNLDLNNPASNDFYEELKPLIDRIKSQQSEIERKQRELKQKKEEFDAATKHMKEGIILLNENGVVLCINQAASKILGITEYCVGKDLLLFNHLLEIQELLHTASTGRHTEIVIAIGGRDYQLNANPIVTDKKLCGIAIILFDITEKENAEESRREFTANVSHELKTPLQNISGYAELLSNGMVKPEDVTTFSARIYSETKRMIVLIEDIIKLSHLDEGGVGYKAQTTDLYAVAEETCHNLSPAANDKKVKISLSGKTAQLYGVRELLSEIVYNLCDNAIKYNRENGSVNVKVEDAEDSVTLSVSDTGIGIPPEEKDRIFERFYRVDKSHSKEVGGTGLGLSIVKHAAIIHNAGIEVESEIGRGTEIRIVFPKKNRFNE